jgi:hypothetical protein
MSKSIHLLFVLFTLPFCLNAKAQKPDAEVVIHERVINRLLQKVGSIKGESTYKVLFVSGKYQWTMEKSSIHLLKDSAFFEAELKVETGFNSYTNKVVGKLSIKYFEETNKIGIKIIDAPFPIILKVFGQEINLSTIQLASYFPEEFLFDGPGTIHTDFSMMMPDNTVRLFRGFSKNHQLIIDRQIIRMLAEVDFQEILPVKNPPFKN